MVGLNHCMNKFLKFLKLSSTHGKIVLSEESARRVNREEGKNTFHIMQCSDPSAKTKKTNLRLHDCLYRVPVILHNICGFWMRFRLERIEIIADIAKHVYQQPFNRKIETL